MQLALFVCTFGYVGYFPVAPGTAGSAAGLAVYAALRWTGAPPVVDLALIALLFAAGVWSGTHAERHFGGIDPRPSDSTARPEATDIIKPWPANRLEALHGGLGMMADDVMAAVYGNLVLRGALALAPAVFSF